MSFKIEMKNIGKFLFRRKWIILFSTIISVLGALIFNASNIDSTNDGGNGQQQIEGNKQSLTEFGFSIEMEDGTAYMSVSQLKTILVNQDNLDNLHKKGVEIDESGLSNSLIVFTRSSKGEIIYFRVMNENPKYVKEIAEYYYQILDEQKLDFVKNKTVYSVKKISNITKDIPKYNDIYTTTNSSIISSNQVVTPAKENQKISPVYVGLIGLAVGILLGLIIDVFNKKIYSMSYIESIVNEKTKIIDSSYDSKEMIVNKIEMLTAVGKAGEILFLGEKRTPNIEDLMTNLGQEVECTLTPNNLKGVSNVIVFVEKGVTEINWLRTQSSFIENISVVATVVFIDKINKKV